MKQSKSGVEKFSWHVKKRERHELEYDTSPFEWIKFEGIPSHNNNNNIMNENDIVEIIDRMIDIFDEACILTLYIKA